ncbi:MAG: YebC/PmpR family DNA-binding transcriptional regulator [bacterium]|nr:YebC/PmpR family DNA-binding transcriptional regulator [Candidatus Microgenomates bacterium CPR3]MCQ3944712.1 YebC/PmpR family DNA-binding transcriptional regulator [bacterium]RIK51086.1 MAG: YebC/PmpR family DNA-binding transcriptional regulator [Candidatus Microgenomates bacterium]
MSGHSKWSNIHRKKEANDKVRSGIFTKLASAIVVAVKKGGGIGDVEKNFALRLAVDKARAASMPKDIIDRAIARGLGKSGEAEMVELKIEAHGPSGLACIIECITDNRNRTVNEVRLILEKHAWRMGEMGSAAYLFKHESEGYTPLYPIQLSDKTQVEEVMEIVTDHPDVQEVYVNLV